MKKVIKIAAIMFVGGTIASLTSFFFYDKENSLVDASENIINAGVNSHLENDLNEAKRIDPDTARNNLIKDENGNIVEPEKIKNANINVIIKKKPDYLKTIGEDYVLSFIQVNRGCVGDWYDPAFDGFTTTKNVCINKVRNDNLLKSENQEKNISVVKRYDMLMNRYNEESITIWTIGKNIDRCESHKEWKNISINNYPNIFVTELACKSKLSQYQKIKNDYMEERSFYDTAYGVTALGAIIMFSICMIIFFALLLRYVWMAFVTSTIMAINKAKKRG